MLQDKRGIGFSIRALRCNSLLVGLLLIVLLPGVLSVIVGTAIGLASCTDVGYPDSAILLRIGEFVKLGRLYPDINHPPYLVTIYGPLTYVLGGALYGMAQAAGIHPQLLLRLGAVSTLCFCILLVYLLGRRLSDSRVTALFCALFAASTLPLADWSTQLRGDFLALLCSLFALYLFLQGNKHGRLVGAAVCAGMAPLVKQTFLAVPIAVVIWLVYRRQYRGAASWAGTFAFVVGAGYTLAWWREPLMLQHIAALRNPILEYRQALDFILAAISQPVVPFAAVGGFCVFWKGAPEHRLLLLYGALGWCMAALAVFHVGGNINYFWEPLFASSVLAGLGLNELRVKAHRTPVSVTVALLLTVSWMFLPTLRGEVGYLRQCYLRVRSYGTCKANWELFLSIVSGRKLLSTFPGVTFHSRAPEIPDPYLNSCLEIRGRWTSRPVAKQIGAGAYELVVIQVGQADNAIHYRGIRKWSDDMWFALRRAYEPVCVLEDMPSMTGGVSESLEVWLPRRGSAELFGKLSAMGCHPVSRRLDGDGTTHTRP